MSFSIALLLDEGCLPRFLNFTISLGCYKNIFPPSKVHANLSLKICGCVVFVHIPSQLGSKLDFRAYGL